jgi:hypothetical protein
VSKPLPRTASAACRDRLLYTLVCLAIFLVCSQLPLYGVKTTSGADPLYWARVIMASSRGTVRCLPACLPCLPSCPPCLSLCPHPSAALHTHGRC